MENNIEVKQILTALEKVEERFKQVQEDLSASEAARKQEAEKFAQKQYEFAQQLHELEQKRVDPENESKEMTLGEMFVKSEGYKNRTSRGTGEIEIKAAGDPILASSNRFTPATRRPGIVQLGSERIMISDIIPDAPITTDAVEWIAEKSFTNNAAPFAEGTAMTASSIEFEKKSAATKQIGHYMPVSNMLIDDEPSLATFVNTRLYTGLQRVIEKQLLLGDGTGENLTGLLTTGNYTAYAPASLEAVGGADATLFDVMRFAKAEVNKWEDMDADYYLVNPEDLTLLQGLKDKNGNYLLGGPGTLSGNAVWGLHCLGNANVTKGKFAVLDSKNTCQRYTRKGYTMEISDSHADFFIKNVKVIKIYTRMLLTVFAPRGVVYGDLALPNA